MSNFRAAQSFVEAPVMNVIFAILCLFATISAKSVKSPPKPSCVVDLTDKTFKDALSPGKGRVFLRFYASW